MIAKRIKELRDQLGMSQSELALILQTSRATINAWESGSAIPHIRHIVLMANLFKVTTDSLINEEYGHEVIVLDGLDDYQKNAVRQIVYQLIEAEKVLKRK